MLPELPIRAVVFDLDGLMFNTEDLYQQVGSEVLGRRGKPFEEELIHAVMGRPSPIALQMMIDWHSLDVTVPQLEQECDQIFAQLLPQKLQPMPGLLSLLDQLEAAQIPKGIATSSTRSFVDRVLNLFELAPRFVSILTCEDITDGKPEPEVYLLAAERLGLEPSQVLVLEDSQNGCRAAVAAGTYAVAVPNGYSRHQDFRGANLVADSLEDPRIYAALGL